MAWTSGRHLIWAASALLLACALLHSLAWTRTQPVFGANGERMAALLWFLQPRHGELAVTQFIGTGIGCASRTVVLAALPLCALLIAVRRGAPLAPARAGALAGGAAFLTAALLMRIDCPLDERLHLLVWHALPVAGGAGLSAVIGFVWLRRWRVRATR